MRVRLLRLRPAARALLAAAALAALSACQVTTAVGVDTKADGSGRVLATVTLDKEASGQVPDFASRLRVDDLRKAGWIVNGPLPTKDGGVKVVASHPFATPAQLGVVMDQLSGANGPFQNFRVTRRRSYFKTRVTFRGRVDLARGLASFSDPALRQRLGGSDLGFNPADLERRIGKALNQIFRFQVQARLPGSAQSNAPVRAGNGAQWTPVLGEQVTLEATSQSWNKGNLVAAAVALAAGLALVVVLGVRLARRRPRPRPLAGPPVL